MQIKRTNNETKQSGGTERNTQLSAKTQSPRNWTVHYKCKTNLSVIFELTKQIQTHMQTNSQKQTQTQRKVTKKCTREIALKILKKGPDMGSRKLNQQKRETCITCVNRSELSSVKTKNNRHWKHDSRFSGWPFVSLHYNIKVVFLSLICPVLVIYLIIYLLFCFTFNIIQIQLFFYLLEDDTKKSANFFRSNGRGSERNCQLGQARCGAPPEKIRIMSDMRVLQVTPGPSRQ